MKSMTPCLAMVKSDIYLSNHDIYVHSFSTMTLEKRRKSHEFNVSLLRCGNDVWPVGLRHGQDWFRAKLVNFVFWYIWKGTGFIKSSDGVESPLRRGVCLLMQPDEIFEAWQDEGSQLGVAFLHFNIAHSETQLIHHGFLESAQIELFDCLISRINDLQLELLYQKPTSTEPLLDLQNQLLKTVLQEFAFELFKEPSIKVSGVDLHKKQVVSECIRKLHENYQKEISIEEMARSAGYSRDHFHRIFKEVTGRTPYDTLISIRMDRAKNFLLNASLSVGEIADLIGFKDIFSFSKQFKQTFSCSPSFYRKNRDH